MQMSKIKLTKGKVNDLRSRHIEHNQMLKKLGLPKIEFDEFVNYIYGKKVNTTVNRKSHLAKSYSLKIPDHRINTNAVVSKETKIVGPADCTKKASPVYTGTMVKGIASMHKSNAVPIFNYKDAIDISKMRR